MTMRNSVSAVPSPEIVIAGAALFKSLQGVQVPHPLDRHLFNLHRSITEEAPEVPARDAALQLMAQWYRLTTPPNELQASMQAMQRAVNAAFYGERHQ